MTGAPVRRRPKDRKQQILVRARDLFVEFGYPNVSMTMIAEQVGITASALYRHYANKADLLEAVVRDAFSAVRPTPAGVMMETVIERDIAVLMERPHLADLWSREVRYLPGDVRQEIRALMRTITRAYASLLQERRPGLAFGRAELLAWSMQSVLSCLGRDSVGLTNGEGPALVRGAARALLDVDLDTAAAGRAPRGAAARSPASRRERLLTAAARQFAVNGYQETSMGEIGAEAGVTGPNLYGYFDSKVELLRAVLERGTHALWLELEAALEDALEVGPGGDVALAAVVAGYVRLSRLWAGVRVNLVGEPDVIEEWRVAQREYVAEWVALLREVRPGLAPGQARALVQMALTVVSDLRHTPHLAQEPSFDDDVTAIALAILRAAPAAPVLTGAAPAGPA